MVAQGFMVKLRHHLRFKILARRNRIAQLLGPENRLVKKEIVPPTLLVRGQVGYCHSNLLIRLLHIHRHPSGLDGRRSRFKFVDTLNPHRACGGIKRDWI